MTARFESLAWILPVTLLLGVALAIGLLAAVDPRAALLGTLGLIFLVIAVLDLTAGLAIFIAVSFVDIGFAGAYVGLTKVFGVVLVLSWLATIAAADSPGRRDFLSERPGFTYLLVLFLAWVAASILWAESAGDTTEAVQRLGLNLLLFPIVYTAVWTQRRALWVVAAFVVGALASAAYGAVDPAVDTEARLTGARFEPNELAAVLVAAVALSLALAGAARGVAARATAIAAAAVCTAAIMFTLSRAGLVALGVVLVAGLVLAARRRGPALLVALVIALGAVGYFGFVAPDAARERVTTVESGTGRLDLWRVGWRMVQDKPLTGVGAGNFEVSSVHYLIEPGEVERSDFFVDKPKVTHNVYLQMAAELGVVGLVLFLAIAAASVVSGAAAMRRFAARDDRTGAALARGAVLATIGLLAADFFASGQFSNQLWFLLAVSPALLGVALRDDRRAASG